MFYRDFLDFRTNVRIFSHLIFGFSKKGKNKK